MTAQPTEKPLFRIDFDGQWFHDGAPVRRRELARLFADKGLRIDPEGKYWLQSPEERYPVAVEDVPFVIVDYDIRNSGSGQSIDLRTSLDQIATLGPGRILELRREPRSGVEVPYVEIRNGLYARLGRAVFYHLVDQARQDRGRLVLRSHGVDHILGKVG